MGGELAGSKLLDAEGVFSIQFAIVLGLLALGTRLGALLRALGACRRAAPAKGALESRDPRKVRAELRRLSALLPFGDLASELLLAAEEPRESRSASLVRAFEATRARVRRRTQNAQALDLATLAVVVGIFTFAHEILPWGVLGLLVAAGSILLLGAGIYIRAILAEATMTALRAFLLELEKGPSQRSFSEATSLCRFCGKTAEIRMLHFTLGGARQSAGTSKEDARLPGQDPTRHVEPARHVEQTGIAEAKYCPSCGRFWASAHGVGLAESQSRQ